MSLEEVGTDVAFNLAEKCLFNNHTKKNAVGAVAGAIGTVAFFGASGPITIPLALAAGALVGATGESTLKGVAGHLAKGITDGISGVLDKFKSAEDFFHRGVERLQSGQPAEAIQDLTKAIELNHQYVDAYFVRGCIRSDTGDFQGAVEDYTHAIQIDRTSVNAYRNRGHIFASQKNYSRAISDYSQVVNLAPDDADTYFRRGQIYIEVKDYQNAVKDYTTVAELDPNCAYAYVKRGFIHSERGEKQKAIADLRTAISLFRQQSIVDQIPTLEKKVRTLEKELTEERRRREAEERRRRQAEERTLKQQEKQRRREEKERQRQHNQVRQPAPQSDRRPVQTLLAASIVAVLGFVGWKTKFQFPQVQQISANQGISVNIGEQNSNPEQKQASQPLPKQEQASQPNTEQNQTSANLQTAQKLAMEAAVLTQNPPHPLNVWQQATEKWQEAVKLLEAVPENTPISAQAKEKLSAYRTNYTALNNRVITEQKAAANLEAAQKLAWEAAVMVQKPPHPIEVWQNAQSKLQQAFGLLQAIPQGTFVEAKAKEKLATYRTNYEAITKQIKAAQENEAF